MNTLQLLSMTFAIAAVPFNIILTLWLAQKIPPTAVEAALEPLDKKHSKLKGMIAQCKERTKEKKEKEELGRLEGSLSDLSLELGLQIPGTKDSDWFLVKPPALKERIKKVEEGMDEIQVQVDEIARNIIRRSKDDPAGYTAGRSSTAEHNAAAESSSAAGLGNSAQFNPMGENEV